jgi:hypothetical protein
MPGIMRKSRVNHEHHAYFLRKSSASCVNHGYHPNYALYQASCVNQAHIKSIMRNSCVNQRYHAFYCFEKADHGMWQVKVVTDNTRWLSKSAPD